MPDLTHLTPDRLRTMPRDDLARLFTDLATAHYGTAAFHAQLADDFHVNKATVYRWQRGSVPWAIVLTLDLWQRGNKPDWRDTQTQLAASETALNSAKAALARILRRS